MWRTRMSSRSLPSDAKERKTYPIATGVIDYFPDALAELSHVSYLGNEQHNPGTPLHWDRSKSGDESDALMRHFIARGTIDSDGVSHSAKLSWRALALLQKELEAKGQVLKRSEEHSLNSSHPSISYAVFCLKKKKKNKT